jgi:hypothetical protein
MHSILNQCNFLTVVERRNFISLKLAYKDFLQDKLELSDRQCRSFPLMKVVAHNTETYKKCLSFRTCKLWNSIPREWELNSLSYVKFKEQVIIHIKSKRDNDYIYY